MLGQTLFGPVASLLRGMRQLNLFTARPIAALPFGAPILEGVPLAMRHSLVVRTGTVLPEYSDRPSPGSGALRVLYSGGQGEKPLSGPQVEAQAVLSLYGGPSGGQIIELRRDMIGPALTPAPAILHIAAHSQVREDDLAVFCATRAEDDPIGMDALFPPSADLRGTTLVFLSGCDSAGHSGGTSLAAWLHERDVRHVIAAHWLVDDAAATEIAIRTHRALASGSEPPGALAFATRQVYDIVKYSSLRFWVAFQCYTA
ncbi:CHAT domain-containing protein [Pseudogemmobacter humi]|uniref:CHAT domain protein n=1 Tax=Pseudogemmobacter humi TaxID=2483812 RepID=A0A3P5X9P0_9RHOB|nr:CHAT domain-containing protein [Pseudogemmobacter humi]VDC27967.1 CHAT domain protein [Pseudogemmobacter humi]